MTNFFFKTTTRKRILASIILILGGFLYYLQTQTIGIFVPCVFHELTTLDCPACGITTASISLLQGNISIAASTNFGLTLSLPLLIPTLLYAWYCWIVEKPLNGKWINVILYFFIVYFLVWGIIRNLPRFFPELGFYLDIFSTIA